MPIQQIYTDSPLRNFTYLLTSDDSREAIIVDPWDAAPLLQELRQRDLKLKAIINTHEHGDHTRGNAGLVEATGAPIWALKSAAATIPHVTRLLADGERIPLGAHEELEVWDTPGHTFSHLCLLLYRDGKPYGIVTGDTLFQAGVGNCRNGGDPNTLYTTIEERLGALPDTIKVYCGHDYLLNNLQFAQSLTPTLESVKSWLAKAKALQAKNEFVVTSMGEERTINHFLRLDAPEWQTLLHERATDRFGAGPYTKKDVFLFLRSLRDNW